VLAKLEEFNNGEIYLNNINIKKVDFKQDLSLGYVPQKFVFKINKTVKQNLEYVLKLRNIEKASINFKMLLTTKNFNIDKILDLPIKSLSNFQKTMVQLARVSMRKVDIFLIDDIAENLIKSEQESIISQLKYMLEQNPDSTFVFAFSDEKFAKELYLKIIHLKNGQIK
jgi:ABC-type sugar transport system ATPase subunit